MTRRLLAITSSLLLLGAAAVPVAIAQDAQFRYPEPLYANGDADHDGIPNGDDPVDDRYDAAGNPAYFEVGETLPPGSYGNANRVDAKPHALRAAPSGHAWHRMGNHFYLVDASGRVVDAVYNLRMP